MLICLLLFLIKHECEINNCLWHYKRMKNWLLTFPSNHLVIKFIKAHFLQRRWKKRRKQKNPRNIKSHLKKLNISHEFIVIYVKVKFTTSLSLIHVGYNMKLVLLTFFEDSLEGHGIFAVGTRQYWLGWIGV